MGSVWDSTYWLRPLAPTAGGTTASGSSGMPCVTLTLSVGSRSMLFVRLGGGSTWRRTLYVSLERCAVLYARDTSLLLTSVRSGTHATCARRVSDARAHERCEQPDSRGSVHLRMSARRVTELQTV